MEISDSSKYDYITHKELIKEGSPSIYKLVPVKSYIETMRRMTLGEKDPNKINKTILLVGETASGKSTLINTLVNYTIGVSREDKVWFEIVEKEEERVKTESQTSDVTVYEIFGFEDQTLPFSLTIIDTPGYGDTRGAHHDEAIGERLYDLFHSDDRVHEINVVGLVLKASVNRLSDRMRYIFDSVMSLFGKDLENSIVALITHSDGLSHENALEALKNAKIKCAQDEENEPVYFMFNNHQSKQETKKNRFALKSAWDLTNDQMSEFTNFLKNSSPKSLTRTVEVLNSRIRLTACIQNLKEKDEKIELKQTEIQQTKEALKKHEEEMESNKNLTVEVDEVYKEKEKVKSGMWGLVFYEGAVTCNVCKENCHYPGCTMAWYPSHCEVMRWGRCTVCTNKCPVSDHVKEDQIYVTKTRNVQKTRLEIKEKYERSEEDCEMTTSLLENLEKRMQDLQRDKDQWLEESFKHVLELEKVALNSYSLSTLIHLDFLIEKMKEKGDEEKVQKLEEMKSRVDEGARAGLRYKLTNSSTAAAGWIKKKTDGLSLHFEKD